MEPKPKRDSSKKENNKEREKVTIKLKKMHPTKKRQEPILKQKMRQVK